MNKPDHYPRKRGTNNESPTFILPTILQMELSTLKTNNIRSKAHLRKYSSETLRKDSSSFFFLPFLEEEHNQLDLFFGLRN